MAEAKKQPRKALSTKNAPRRLPVWFVAIVWLLMDRWDPAGWVWGVVFTVVAIIAVAAVVDFFRAEDVELP